MKQLLMALSLIASIYCQTKNENIKKESSGFVKTIQVDFNQLKNKLDDFQFQASTGEIDILQTDKAFPYLITKIFIRVKDEADAKEVFDEFNIDVEEVRNRLIVYFQDRLNHRNNYGWEKYFQVSHSIYINKNVQMDCRTSGGSIGGSDLTNTVRGKTSGGNIKFRNVNGALDINTSGGNIDMETITGEVDVNTSGGNITMININGKLSAKTSGGSISLEKIKGEVDARTSGGDIHLTDISSYADAKTSGGSIRFKDIKNGLNAKTSGGNIRGYNLAGAAVLETNGGNINAKNVMGPISAENGSGDIELTLNLDKYDGSKSSYITTDHGDIVVEISQTSSFEAQLSAHSYFDDSRDNIYSDFDINYRGKRATAKNLDAKHQIFIETSGGKIKLLKLR
ncbi:MAG: hypothetical protein KDD94_10365 [Calditrichaeota bacterium]|nr:hypothetical protein [Calditrichota bacterium]